MERSRRRGAGDGRLGLQAALVAGVGLLVSWWMVAGQVDPATVELEPTPRHIAPTADRRVPPSGLPLVDVLTHLDAHWYFDIAMHGYRVGPGQSNAVFFPLYPLLLRAGHALSGLPVQLVGVAVSQLLTVVAAILLARLAVELHPERRPPERLERLVPLVSVLLLVFHPAGVFLRVCYGESLFLALFLGLMLAARRQQLVRLALLAVLAALARPQGLFVPLGFGLVDGVASLRERRLRVRRETLVVGAAAVLALGLFAAVLGRQTGAPLSFWTKRPTWDPQATFLNLFRVVWPDLGRGHFLAYTMLYLTLGGALLLWRRGARTLAAVCGLFVLLPLQKGNAIDLVRYSLPAVPALVPVAGVGRRRPLVIFTLVAASAAFFAFNLQRWLLHQWVG